MPSRPWGQGALSHTSNHGAGRTPVSDSHGTGVCQRHQMQISEQFFSSQQGLWVAGWHLLHPTPGLGILSAQKETFRYSLTLKDLTISLHGQDKHTLNQGLYKSTNDLVLKELTETINQRQKKAEITDVLWAGKEGFMDLCWTLRDKIECCLVKELPKSETELTYGRH